MKESMVLGTAGLTAVLSVYKLSSIVEPGSGTIAVSGATGGVGSLSLSILAAAGYRSAAITRKPEQEEYLKSFGADEVILSEDIEAGAQRPLLRARFAGGIDSVGGPVLQNIIKSVQPLGAVTCCGNAASDKLDMTVYPFILRGISLIGIDSQDCPNSLREKIWNKLASKWRPAHLMDIFEEIELEDLPERIEKMLKGEMRGRVIIRHKI
jgi:putative YhdH/YhfP family quinone oxidoreductase